MRPNTAPLLARCRERGILFMSTPFDRPSMQLLHELGLAIGKVPSGEIAQRTYLEAMARTFPDLIVSTGMCTLEEVGQLLMSCSPRAPTREGPPFCIATPSIRPPGGCEPACHAHGWPRSSPPPSASVTIPGHRSAHRRHRALGARVIEKHMTLDREMPGPDHRASLEPHEFKAMVRAVRAIERALGTG